MNETNTGYAYIPGGDAAKISGASRQFNDTEEMDCFAGALDDIAALAADESEAIQGYWDFLEHHAEVFGDKADVVRKIIVGIIQDEKAHTLILNAVAMYLDKAHPAYRPELLALCRDGLGVCPEAAACLIGSTEGYNLEGLPADDSAIVNEEEKVKIAEPAPIKEPTPQEPEVRISVSVDAPGDGGGYASVCVKENDADTVEAVIASLKESFKIASDDPTPNKYYGG